MQIGVLEPIYYSERAIDALSSIGDVTEFDGQDLDGFLNQKNILFVRLGLLLDANFLDKAVDLKFICSPTTGLNHIDLEECRRRGITVLSLKGEVDFLNNIRATPEHTFGLILSLLRNYKSAFLGEVNRNWDRALYIGEELQGKTVGIIGLGRVGRVLTKYVDAFGASVAYFDSDKSIDHDIARRCESLTDLITQSDVVVLSASYSESSKGLLYSKYIDLLAGKYFVNTARGELVDEEYLLELIENNAFRGVALDVICDEAATVNNKSRLLSLVNGRNLIVTPHIAGATYESMHKTEEFLVAKLKAVLD